MRSLAALGVLMLLAGGCTLLQEMRKETPETTVADLVPGDFAEEIRKIEGEIRTDGGTQSRARKHMRLAELYASYQNPGTDYDKALDHLERFAALAPKDASAYDVQNWLRILGKLSEAVRARDSRASSCQSELENAQQSLAKEQSASEALRKHNKEQEGKIKELQKENERLEEKIEKLKFLDLRLEEKRRSYK